MLLVDDLLLSPFTSLLWVFKEIHKAVQQEKAGETETVTRSLSELYMKLETGAITEEEFAAEEQQLLDRLDAIERRNQGGDEEADDESDDESDEGEDDANGGGRLTR
ncbi:MAG: gas vesicle protein GvpG [Chloroflexota bacterium]